MHLFNRVLTEGAPPEWGEIRWAPIYKAQRENVLESFRFLAVTQVLYRMFFKIVAKRVQAWVASTKVLPATQFGFIEGRQCMHAWFAAHQKIVVDERFRQRSIGVLVDMTAAYDTVNRARLWEKLGFLGFPKRLIAVVKSVYDHNVGHLAAGGTTIQVDINVGVFQGCPLSPILFDCYIHDLQAYVSNKMGDDGCFHTLRREEDLIGYADDLLLLCVDVEHANAGLAALKEYCDFYHLKLNPVKTKAVLFRAGDELCVGEAIVCDGVPVEVVQKSKFLGLDMSQGDIVGCIIAGRVLAARRQRGNVFELMRQYDVRRDNCMVQELFEGLVMGTMGYGLGFWGPLVGIKKASTAIDDEIYSFCRRFWKLPYGVPKIPLLWEVGWKRGKV